MKLKLRQWFDSRLQSLVIGGASKFLYVIEFRRYFYVGTDVDFEILRF